MDTDYKQLSPEHQLIEECSEVIKSLCKLMRFGVTATDFKTGKVYNNLQDCRNEIKDIEAAIAAFENKWSETE